MRGAKPKRSPALRNFSQSSSSSRMRASMSRVNRGRPSKDAATPPIMRPETLSDFSQSIRAASVVSGGRLERFLVTIESAEFHPCFADFFRSIRVGFSPAKILSACKQGIQLLELACHRCSPQLLYLFGVDKLPPFLKGSSLRLSHLVFHMSPYYHFWPWNAHPFRSAGLLERPTANLRQTI